ncbi:MAG TPA: hypothetical protein VNK43_10705 [Gemmatimonadales bacterium]|nr:hypothetical protein [Gemmatimonadales bacterium]
MASELGGSQISTLLEALPGIANVLRNPVADALISVIRSAARLSELQVADAEELIRYAVRRGLIGAEEGERTLAEVQDALRRRAERTAEREKAAKARAKARPKPAGKKPVKKAAKRRK